MTSHNAPITDATTPTIAQRLEAALKAQDRLVEMLQDGFNTASLDAAGQALSVLQVTIRQLHFTKASEATPVMCQLKKDIADVLCRKLLNSRTNKGKVTKNDVLNSFIYLAANDDEIQRINDIFTLLINALLSVGYVERVVDSEWHVVSYDDAIAMIRRMVR